MDEKGLNPEVLLRTQWILWSAMLGGSAAFLGLAQISMVPHVSPESSKDVFVLAVTAAALTITNTVLSFVLPPWITERLLADGRPRDAIMPPFIVILALNDGSLLATTVFYGLTGEKLLLLLMIPPLAMFFRMKPSLEKLDVQARSVGL